MPKMARPPRRFAGSRAVPLREVLTRLGGSPATAVPDPELAARVREAAGRFPVRWTRHYLELVDPADPADPIRRIALPDAAELVPGRLDLEDPVGERRVNPLPFVVRKHRDRAVLLVSSRCHVYCRFCFRRAFPDGAHRDPSASELERALDYLVDDGELREVILSGGDPLALPDAELARIIERLSASRHLRSLRLHTRAPVHDPARVTPRLAGTLACGLPLWVVLHFNHAREIGPPTLAAADTLRGAGLPLLNQTVLLASVNDDAGRLEELCRGLLAARIKPYYLHHPDRVPGAAKFYVPLSRGLAIYRELRERLGGGPALPAYVIDLPDGSGKVPVETLDRADPRLAGAW